MMAVGGIKSAMASFENHSDNALVVGAWSRLMSVLAHIRIFSFLHKE